MALAAASCAFALGTSQAGASAVAAWLSMQNPSSPEAKRPLAPSILGTVAVPIRARSTSTRWSKLMRASINQPALAHIAEGAQGLSLEEQLAFVQSAVNRSIRTAPTTYNCSDDGYWAPASETLARGMGDCIDVAVAKMEALRFLGFPNDDLFLTTGRFRSGTGSDDVRETAALLVRIDERFWIMSERSGQVIAADGAEDDAPAPFTPIFTYGIGGTWVHGRPMTFAAVHD